MTEFRSKGKGRNRKVFPINPRKPYGVSRELAAEEVQALRDKGQKARLIKTNRKKELYAPYEGVLPVDQWEGPKLESTDIPSKSRGIRSIDVTQKFEIMKYADSLSDEPEWKHKPLIEKYDFGPVAFGTDSGTTATVLNARSEEQKEMAQKIIDAVNKKYGVEYSLWKDKSGLMVYKLEPSEGKPVRYESPKSTNKPKALATSNNVKVKFDMEGDRKRGGVYAAVITGTDPRYGLKREFLNGDKTTVNNHYVNKHFNTELPKGTIVELSNEQNAGFYIVDPKEPDGLRDLHLTNKGQDLLKMKQHFRKKEEQ